MGRRELLVALRDRISDELDAGVPARDLASLSRRLMGIAEQLELSDAADDAIAQAAALPDEPWGGDRCFFARCRGFHLLGLRRWAEAGLLPGGTGEPLAVVPGLGA